MSLSLTPKIAAHLRRKAEEVVSTLACQPSMPRESRTGLASTETYGKHNLTERETLLLSLAEGLLLALDEVERLRNG